jgi:hypothetical protein
LARKYRALFWIVPAPLFDKVLHAHSVVHAALMAAINIFTFDLPSDL